MMPSMLPRTSPAAAGLEADRFAAGLAALVDAAAATRLELHSLMVVRRGHVVAQGWWEPYRPDGIALVYSLSKALTTTGVGIAVGEGLLDVDAPLSEVLGDLMPTRAAAWARTARVRDLLTMASGHAVDAIEVMARAADAGRDPLRAFLELPAEHSPGTLFTYNQGCTLTLAAALARVTGQRLVDWLRPRLLEPLGIEHIDWTLMGGVPGPTGAGLEMGYSGAHLGTEAIAALGELWRCEGRWGGRQLLPAEYVAAASGVRIATAGEIGVGMDGAADWERGYGYQLWASRHGYRGDGAFGQFCLVLPQQEAVVVLTAQTTRMQDEIDLVWRHLIPVLADRPHDASAAADGATVADGAAVELTGLRLPPPAGGFTPGAGLLDTAHPVGTPEQLRHVHSVRLTRGGGVLLMTWRADGADHSTRVGVGEWVRGELPHPPSLRPAVATAAVADADSVTVSVIYVESPHSLTLTITRDGARMRWRTAPLRWIGAGNPGAEHGCAPITDRMRRPIRVVAASASGPARLP